MQNDSLFGFYFISFFIFFFFTLTLQPGEANRSAMRQREALNAKYTGRREIGAEAGRLGGGGRCKKEKKVEFNTE